jgi:hypothetical protein
MILKESKGVQKSPKKSKWVQNYYGLISDQGVQMSPKESKTILN